MSIPNSQSIPPYLQGGLSLSCMISLVLLLMLLYPIYLMIKFTLYMLISFILFPNLPFHCTQSGMVSSLMWLEGEYLQETEIGTREIS